MYILGLTYAFVKYLLASVVSSHSLFMYLFFRLHCSSLLNQPILHYRVLTIELG